MSIKVNDGFQLGSGVAIDSRLVLTLDQMAAMNDAVMPPVYLATCLDNGKLYLYSKENEKAEDTGRFRLFDTTPKVTSNLILQDETDLKTYELRMDNGRIFIEETDKPVGDEIKLTDDTTGLKYILKIKDKELYAEEVE